jgi:hypothetical protein
VRVEVDQEGTAEVADVVETVGERLSAARRALVIARKWEVLGSLEVARRAVGPTVARDVATGLWAIEVALADALAVGDAHWDDDRRARLGAVRELVAYGATVVGSSAATRSGTDEWRDGASGSGCAGGVAGGEWAGVRELGNALEDGSARAFGRAMAHMQRAQLASTVRELETVIAALARCVLVIGRCGRGPRGMGVDVVVRAAAEGPLRDAGEMLGSEARRLLTGPRGGSAVGVWSRIVGTVRRLRAGRGVGERGE